MNGRAAFRTPIAHDVLRLRLVELHGLDQVVARRPDVATSTMPRA
jgi:hypothetical protein